MSISITHEGGNCKAVLANGKIEYWVTANASYSADGDNITVTRDGTEVFTADKGDITIDGEDAYGTATDVIEQIQAADVINKKLELVAEDTGSSSSSYLVYTALLTQSGTDAPVATVLQNTLGGTVVWTRDAEGHYLGTLSNAFPEPNTAYFVTDGGTPLFKFSMWLNDVSSVAVDTYYNGATSDGRLYYTPVTIWVFP